MSEEVEVKKEEENLEQKYMGMLTSMQDKYNLLEKRLKDYEQKEIELHHGENEKKIKEAEKNKDVKSINENWERQFKEVKEKYEKEIQMKNNFIEKQLIDNVAINLANEISTAPELIMPHIKERLTVQFDNEEPVTKVLDINGNMSPYQVEDLKKEMMSDKKFAPIMKASTNSDRGFQLAQPSTRSTRTTPPMMNDPQANPNTPYNELVRREMNSLPAAEARMDKILNGTRGYVR